MCRVSVLSSVCFVQPCAYERVFSSFIFASVLESGSHLVFCAQLTWCVPATSVVVCLLVDLCGPEMEIVFWFLL